MVGTTLLQNYYLKLLPHSLGVAYRGSSLVCYSVTYLEYKSACRVVYTISLSHISDIRELAMAFLLLTENYISKATLNIYGKVYAPSLHKVTKVTPSRVKGNWRIKQYFSYLLISAQLIHFYCVALIL